MPVNDELGLRMKSYYEEISKTKLMRRTPVAIRIDGKAFHTFTRGFQKPFDEVLVKSMQETMKYLCENIQGCVLGYTQSDEITLILVDYNRLDTNAWFGYEVQKMCSIAASMATMAFNKSFASNVAKESKRLYTEYLEEKDASYIEALEKAMNKGAMFDARCFNIPKEEVTNLLYWRQLDAARNSVQMVGQAYFSHSELQNKSCSNIQDMLMEKYEINWNNFPTHLKRGSCCIKNNTSVTYAKTLNGEVITWAPQRPHWEIDTEIPMFKNEGRNYVENLIHFEELDLDSIAFIN